MTTEKITAAQKFQEMTIKTDGTAEGTVILLNGKEIKGLGSLSFIFWNDGYYPPLALGFSTFDTDVKPGELAESKHFSLVPPKSAEGEGAEASEAQPAVIVEKPAAAANLIPRMNREDRMAAYREIGSDA